MPTTLTSRLPELCARLGRLATFALLLGLAACGPGTGGTGTGPVQTMAASFSGDAITGAATAAGGDGLVTPGNPACAAGCGRTTLRLDAALVELVAPCRRFVFNGASVVDANGLLVLSGLLDTSAAAGTTSATTTTPATLRLQFSERTLQSAQVTFTLTSESGALLLGPALLQRNDDAAAATATPPSCSAGERR